MIKNLKNLFKPPAKRREKENDDPFLLANTHSSHYGGGQRRMQAGRSVLHRRVNFRGQGGTNFDCMDQEDSEDGGSEVTLTTAANEPHQGGRQPLPNPYSVVTEPKRNRGPRSCPGGGRMFDIDEELSHSSAGRGTERRGVADHLHHHHQQHQFMDDSLLDTRSEFIAPAHQRQQHRRSCRRRAVADEEQQQQQPLREIGNNNGGGGRATSSSRRLSVADFYPYDGHRRHQQLSSAAVVSSSSSRYKNVPLTERQMRNNFADDDSGTDWELWNLNRLYQLERAKRKELQQKLRNQQEDNERLKNQYNTLWMNCHCLLARQQPPQQSATVFPPSFPNFASEMLEFGGGGIFNSNNWNGGTPSSCSAIMPSTPGGAAGRQPAPTLGGGGPAQLWPPPASVMMAPPPLSLAPAHHHHHAQQQQRHHQQQSHNQQQSNGGAGEQLASLFSAVSIDHHRHHNAPIVHHHRQQSAPPPPPPIPPRDRSFGQHSGLNGDTGGGVDDLDELKDFRRGQHNTDSFSGSSRPTTGERIELEQLKEDLVTDSSKESHHNTTPADDDEENQALSDLSPFPPNYSSMTTPEAARGDRPKGNGTFLGISFSADTICAAGGAAFPLTDSPTPPPKDDGYATSETNLSDMGTVHNEKQRQKMVSGTMHRSKSLE